MNGLIPLQTALKMMGIHRSMWYRHRDSDRFPKGTYLNGNCIVMDEKEVQDWIERNKEKAHAA